MTQQHPITPPPSELVLQWIGDYFGCTAGGELSDSERFLTARAAQWGADQELEALLTWLRVHHFDILASDLLAARRPKPPSLKEQALTALNEADQGLNESEWQQRSDTIRRALEQLND